MKIYTKKGDQGQTSLIGGSRVPKSHSRVIAYGAVDELNSWLGLLRDLAPDGSLVSSENPLPIENPLPTENALPNDHLVSGEHLFPDKSPRPSDSEERNILLNIQQSLFVIGSLLSCNSDKYPSYIPFLNEEDVRLLEREIDRMEVGLPFLQNFILPGGHMAVSHCHIARCVCRRAEREVVSLNSESPVEPLIIAYLNRLSDFLFVLARKWSCLTHTKEIPWRG